MKTAPLGEVAQFIRGVTFKPSDVIHEPGPDVVGVMRTKNVQQELDLDDVVYIPKALAKRSDQIIPFGDTLVSSANSWAIVGKCCWVPDVEAAYAIGGFITGIRSVSEHLDARYLYRWLSSTRTQALLRGTANQTTNIANLNLRRCEMLEVPLPPLVDQLRIAEILDHADALRAKRRHAITLLDDLVEATFQDMFGPPSDWPGRWAMGTIGDMAEDVQYGTAAKAGSSGALPVIRMGNVTDAGRLDLSDLKWMDLEDKDVARFTVRRGDLLFNRTNSKEKVGKTCVVTTDRPLAFAGYLVRVRFKPQHRPEFVNAFMTSRFGRAIRLGMAKSAVNQANINATEMRSIPIALPPSRVQEDFALVVAKIEAAREQQLVALDRSDDLFESLQARAFCGQL